MDVGKKGSLDVLDMSRECRVIKLSRIVEWEPEETRREDTKKNKFDGLGKPEYD